MLLTKSPVVPNSAFQRFLSVREEARVSVVLRVRPGTPADHPVQRRVSVLSDFASLGYGRVELGAVSKLLSAEVFSHDVSNTWQLTKRS
jgi:hypothetical protein